MSPEDIAARIRPHLEAAGLLIVKIDVEPYEPGVFEEIPVANVYVDLVTLGADEVYKRMTLANRAMNRAFGHNVDSGYYSAAIGYEDIPADQAMLEFGDLPFCLDPPAPGPRPL